MTVLPPKVQNIDPDTSSQADVASWIVSNQKRMVDLENLVITILEFLKTEQDKLDEAAKKKNSEDSKGR